MSVFRRKQHTPEEQAFEQALGEMVDRAEEDSEVDEEATGTTPTPEEPDDDIMRLDFGSLRVPAVDGMQVRADLDGEEVVAISVMIDDTALQLQAFAAPRSESLWDEVRHEIAEGIRGGQGRAREADGPFGRELHAEVPVENADGRTARQPARFIGRDGSRWFLRGVVTGPGATDSGKAAGVESLFADVVVIRGSHAAAPREPLPLRLPEDSRLTGEPPGSLDT